jgi:hypothetical protein
MASQGEVEVEGDVFKREDAEVKRRFRERVAGLDAAWLRAFTTIGDDDLKRWATRPKRSLSTL